VIGKPLIWKEKDAFSTPNFGIEDNRDAGSVSASAPLLGYLMTDIAKNRAVGRNYG
jgi:hypothetical protein